VTNVWYGLVVGTMESQTPNSGLWMEQVWEAGNFSSSLIILFALYAIQPCGAFKKTSTRAKNRFIRLLQYRHKRTRFLQENLTIN
jgi:hypothetical protein